MAQCLILIAERDETTAALIAIILLMTGTRLMCGSMEQLSGLPSEAFDKEDPSPDAEFYDFPRFVTHIDDAAIETVTNLYRSLFPPGGTVLDLMSSWVSHLPEDVAYASV